MPRVPWQVKAFTKELLTNTADLALFLVAFGAGVASRGKSVSAVHEAAAFAQGVTVESISRAIRLGREKGWIKRDLTVTREGQKRLSSLLPQVRPYPRFWGNVWHLVSFDIPRKLNHQRDRLRDHLRHLGFGKLHDSLWIFPYNFLGDVLEYAKVQRLEQYLIPATSKELGREHSRDLADRVWHLRELDMRYLKFIGAVRGNELPSPQLFFDYVSALGDDPFLPRPLLPEDWMGDRAHVLARKTFPEMLGLLLKQGKELKEEYTEKDPREALGLVGGKQDKKR